MIRLRSCANTILAVTIASLVTASAVQAQSWTWKKLPDPRGEFVRLCSPHMVGRWAHPESVCSCLYDHAIAAVQDGDMREALLRGVSERGVPTIESEWIPASKQPMISATFSQIAKPTLQCMFEPAP